VAMGSSALEGRSSYPWEGRMVEMAVEVGTFVW